MRGWRKTLVVAAALGVIMTLVRALNSAIDSGELGAADVPAGLDVGSSRSLVRGPEVPAAGRYVSRSVTFVHAIEKPDEPGTEHRD